jgi:uncharacterized protein involved in oxidation of intracellular sulfur
MKVLVILNREPYDGTDVTWNALRLVRKLHEKGVEVTIFLMNDAVDLAREGTVKPESYDQDLVKMLKELINLGIPVKACGTCMARCGINAGKPYFEGVEKATMDDLAELVIKNDQVLTF